MLSKYLWYVDKWFGGTLKKTELLFACCQQGSHSYLKVEGLKEELAAIYVY